MMLRQITPTDKDYQCMVALLEGAQLPTGDLAEDGARYYALGEPPKGFVGIVPHGDLALLRSLVVAQKASGIGRQIAEAALQLCIGSDLREVWLLTNTAEQFFAKLGFEKAPREAAPNSIASARQFCELCPASASLMRLRLT